MRVQTAEVNAGEGDTRHLFVRCLFLALGPRVPPSDASFRRTEDACRVLAALCLTTLNLSTV